MKNAELIKQAVATIGKKINGFKPKLAIILGSGLNKLSETLTDVIAIPYGDIPGFKKPTVAGHGGILSFGFYKNVPIACMQGRAHYYEGQGVDSMIVAIRALKSLGVETLIITNAVGSLRQEVAPGNLVVITDHINFQGRNPLVGENDDQFGPRFLPMTDVYDPQLRSELHRVAKQLKIPLYDGIYLSVLGPNYETPAEIRAFKMLGADVLGMSTVPDVMIAHHCGLKILTISAVTNFAAGLSGSVLNHDDVLHVANQISKNFTELLFRFIEEVYG